MKPKLIILSDLWGRKESTWIAYYVDILEKHFAITYYDCCELGGVDMLDYNEESLHSQFISGGIEKAIENLCHLERYPVSILGFSIGGYIAWKAALAGLKTQQIVAISSTRLRKETEKPNSNITLFFGENDPYQPTAKWFQEFKIKKKLITGEGHDFYTNPAFAELLSNEIIKRIPKQTP